MAVYLDQKKLHAALEEHLLRREEAIEKGEPIPQVSNFIGENIYLLCTNLARRPNFSGYSFREEMIDNAIELCLRYIHNYDFRKYHNPHAYFTQYAWRGFVDQITLEEKHAYIRAKLAIAPEEMKQYLQEVDRDMRPDMDDISIPYFDIDAYEKKHLIKTKIPKDDIIGLEEFIEEFDEVNGMPEFKEEEETL